MTFDRSRNAHPDNHSMLSSKTHLSFFISCLVVVCLFSLPAFAQDSSLYKWEVSSSKTAEHVYELTFKTNGNKNWQLYGANEIISEVPSTTLELDSSVGIEKDWRESGKSKTIKS